MIMITNYSTLKSVLNQNLKKKIVTNLNHRPNIIILHYRTELVALEWTCAWFAARLIYS